MASIYELVTSNETKLFYEEFEAPDYVGRKLFPPTKQLGLDINYLKGRGGAPVQLQPASFDAEAPLRGRIGTQGVSTEMPFFREGMLISEKDRQQINTFLANNNTEAARILVKRIFEDAKELLDGAEAIVERMRMQVLAYGSIAIVGKEGVAVDYNYGLTEDQKKTLAGSDAWTSPDADPIADIEEAMQVSGAKRCIMNGDTFSILYKHPKVMQAVEKTGVQFISKRAVLSFFENEVGLSIGIYDAGAKEVQNGPEVKFFPKFKVTFLPESTLGETVYGTTPEESDLLNKVGVADVSIVNTGVAIKIIHNAQPVTVETWASQIVMPSFPAADKVYILTVGA